MRKALAFTALALLVSACSDSEPPSESAPPPAPSPAPAAEPDPAPPEPRPQATVREYQCADGLLFNVTFLDQEATLQLQQQRFDLHRQPSASGELYTDDRWNLLTKGERAMLTGEDLTHECEVRTARSVPAEDLLSEPADPLDSGEG